MKLNKIINLALICLVTLSIVGCSNTNNTDNTVEKKIEYKYEESDYLEYLNGVYNFQDDGKTDKLEVSKRQESVYYLILETKIKDFMFTINDNIKTMEFKDIDIMIKEVENVKEDLDKHTNISQGSDEIKDGYLLVLNMIDEMLTEIKEGYGKNNDLINSEEEKIKSLNKHINLIYNEYEDTHEKRIEVFKGVDVKKDNKKSN